MSNPLTDALVGLESWEIENLAKGWLDPQVKANVLTEAQEDVLVAAAPLLINLIAEMVLAKQKAAAAPSDLPPTN